MKNYFLASALLLCACGASQKEMMASSLNVLARSVDEAAEHLRVDCNEREEQAIATSNTYEQSHSARLLIQAECDAYFRHLERIRIAHEAAVTALVTDTDDLESVYTRALELWEELRRELAK